MENWEHNWTLSSTAETKKIVEYTHLFEDLPTWDSSKSARQHHVFKIMTQQA